MTSLPYKKNFNFLGSAHPRTDDLTGKSVRLTYASGHVLEQHWKPNNTVLWRGVSGPLTGYEQTETYEAFKIAQDIYLICWIEKSTAAVAEGGQIQGTWLTDVILDFRTMHATASWTGPTLDGGSEHVLDQATMEFCPPAGD
ncbi:MoaF-related domain-containing protein [Labrys neptuniae]